MRSREEFKAELLRRCKTYNTRKAARRRSLMFAFPAAACLFIALALFSPWGFGLPIDKGVDSIPEGYTAPEAYTDENGAPIAAVLVEIRALQSSDDYYRSYTNAGQTGKITAFLDGLTLTGEPAAPQAEAGGVGSIITVSYANGSKATYTILEGRYLKRDGGDWMLVIGAGIAFDALLSELESD